MAASGTGVPLGDVAHVIQVALTPVFLLSGIGTLLNVVNTRLARVNDHLEHAAEVLAGMQEGDPAKLGAQVARMRRRTATLYVAMALGVMAGASTCFAILTLYLGTLRDARVTLALFALFGLAIACTTGSLIAFLGETMLSWHGLRTDGPLPRPR